MNNYRIMYYSQSILDFSQENRREKVFWFVNLIIFFTLLVCLKKQTQI